MTIAMTPFLRKSLLADAATSSLAAMPMIFASGLMAELLAIPAGLIFSAGLALPPFIALLLVVARRAEVSRGWLREIVIINGAWVIASFGLLVFGLVSPNLLGTLFIVAQALAVALFTALQFTALRASSVQAA